MRTKLIAVGFFLVAFSIIASANLLLNPGFETGDLSDWSSFGQGWRTGTGGDANSGTYGAVCDVLPADVDEWRGLFQLVLVDEGSTYTYSAYQRGVALESSESFLELQWLDNSGGVISQLQSPQMTADQGYAQVSIADAVAPAGAVTASVRTVVHMTSAPSDGDFHTFDDFSFAQQIPEPGTFALVGLGLCIGAVLLRRRK